MAEKQIPSLDGLIQTKGAARPENPVKALQASLHAAANPGREPRAKSLTLRLSEGQYERLRQFAFERRMSHQDIIERALLEHLDRA
jgi:hypothetical protein